MSIKFEWNDNYSVGNDLIDEQHRTILELANSVPTTEDAHAIREAIMALYRYTREHFLAEEALMRDVGYPGLAAHERMHGKLIGDLNAIAQQRFKDPASIHEFRKFVYMWVIDHLMNQDQDFFMYLRSR